MNYAFNSFLIINNIDYSGDKKLGSRAMLAELDCTYMAELDQLVDLDIINLKNDQRNSRGTLGQQRRNRRNRRDRRNSRNSRNKGINAHNHILLAEMLKISKSGQIHV